MTVTGKPGGILVYILYFFILLPIFLFINKDSNKSKLIFLRVNAFIGVFLLYSDMDSLLFSIEHRAISGLFGVLLYIYLCVFINFIFFITSFFVKGEFLLKGWWIFTVYGLALGCYMVSMFFSII